MPHILDRKDWGGGSKAVTVNVPKHRPVFQFLLMSRYSPNHARDITVVTE